MNKFKHFIVFLITGCSSICYGQQNNFSWPGGAKAAVCLTYDDGIDSHLNIAIPDLERENLIFFQVPGADRRRL
jgi:sialate O-acetylesterase